LSTGFFAFACEETEAFLQETRSAIDKGYASVRLCGHQGWLLGCLLWSGVTGAIINAALSIFA
jgi:hypothetical protein